LFAQLAAPDKPEDGIDVTGAIGEAVTPVRFPAKACPDLIRGGNRFES
jgi:hypothetical protein